MAIFDPTCHQTKLPVLRSPWNSTFLFHKRFGKSPKLRERISPNTRRVRRNSRNKVCLIVALKKLDFSWRFFNQQLLMQQKKPVAHQQLAWFWESLYLTFRVSLTLRERSSPNTRRDALNISEKWVWSCEKLLKHQHVHINGVKCLMSFEQFATVLMLEMTLCGR